MTVIVSDTSPITSLIQIGRLDLVNQVFGSVVIPDAVYAELCRVPQQEEILNNQNWIFFQKAKKKKKVVNLEIELDPGEAEAIILALEIKADYLLIDEWKGREKAEELGIKIIGVLGLLLRAKNEGFISAVKILMDELIYKAEFRIHPALYQQVLKSAGE